MDASQIKSQVSIEQVLSHYGHPPNEKGVFQCPFPENHNHGDSRHSGSRSKGRAYCNSQGCLGPKGSDIFALVGLLENLPTFPEQKAWIETSFGLSNGDDKPFTILRSYYWVDAQGRTAHHLRVDDKSKFKWNQKADGTGGWTLKPCQPDLYQRDQVIAAQLVVVCAGERDCDTINQWLRDLGKYPETVANCNHTGESSVKAESFYLLHGKQRVFVVADNDKTGQGYREEVCGFLQGKVQNIFPLSVPSQFNDASEWAENGATAEAFLALLEHAKPVGPDFQQVEGLDAVREQLIPNKHSTPTLKDALLDYPAMLSLNLPERKTLFPFLPEGGIAMAYGPRGVGKTFFNITMAASLCTGTAFFRWEAPPPTGVLVVDGEMDLDELRNRMTALLPEQPKAPLTFLTSHHVFHKLERDLVLTDAAIRQEITSILDDNPELRVLILDNISCLFSGIDEDKKSHWEPIQAWLVRLRHRGITTLLVHHAGKGGQQRGTSGREDALDTVIQLSKPAGYSQQEGCHFEITFTKCRSATGDELEPLDAKLIEIDGRLEWTWKSLAVSKEEQARKLFDEGVTSPSELAEELEITKGYASKLLRKIKATDGVF